MNSPENQLRRYSTVSGVVADHKKYGLLLHLENGVEGFVDSSDVADRPVDSGDWPSVGITVMAVVLGPTQMGRWRLSMRDRDIRVVTALEDPQAEFGYWDALKVAGPGNSAARDAFLSSPSAVPLLRWALACPWHSSDRKLAEELLATAPGTVKEQFDLPD
ncbi:S1 RNA-binding domain-containing protein [Paractinoplanes toevensis]|uniref:S1 motif domain-containing protein n=1 Tax=Paractinoplanes toevensis TaxID=571911 RepID=A0A919T8M4_9ACTN|nr:hypothetical protein Ato02nite_025050 [Actinoplanes toevensis]